MSPLRYAAYYGSRALYLVEGTARVGAGTVPWSAVLKVIAAGGESDAPAVPDALYGNREVRFYRSRLRGRLPRGLAAPRLLHLERRPSTVWLWLERIEDAYGRAWPPAQYGIAARHLGRFNGAFASVPQAPAALWRDRRWAEWHVEPARLSAMRGEVAALLEHSAIRRATSADVRRSAAQLLDDLPLLMEKLDRLPTTLCHHDASSANLFARRTDRQRRASDPDAWETVAIDWEELGPGPIGAELATLVFGSMRRGDFPATHAHELERAALRGYRLGLHDAGWRGSAEDVRAVHFAYAASVALRWWIVPGTLRLVTDPHARDEAARAAGRSAADTLRERLALMRFLLDRADEARRMMRDVA